jgi:hypothetical protein
MSFKRRNRSEVWRAFVLWRLITTQSGTPLYKEEDNPMWNEWVHTFFELRKNHRFKDDKKWGKLLDQFRDIGPTKDDVKLINSRVIGTAKGPSLDNIPENAVYATKTNMDRMAINDDIFAKHVAKTCSRDSNVEPPKHTICIKASALKWPKG